MADPTPAAIEAALIDAEAIVKRSWERTTIARHDRPINHWAGPWWHCGWIQYFDSYGWITSNVWLNVETGERRIMQGGAPDGIVFDPGVKDG